MEGVWFLGEKKHLGFRSDISEPQIKNPDDVKVKVAFSGNYCRTFIMKNKTVRNFGR